MRELFDTAYAFFTDTFGVAGPVYAIAALGLLLMLLAAPLVLAKREDPMDRIKKLNSRDPGPDLSPEGTLRDRSGDEKLKTFAAFLEPSDQGELSDIRLKLLKAGYRSKGAVRMFYLARAAGAIGLLLLTLLIMGIASEDPDPVQMMLFGGMLFLVGYFAPSYWLTKRKQEREKAIQDGFPDALDMMLVCVEAGQSLDQSIGRVSMEIFEAHPPLAEELTIVANEMRVGKDRQLVLRDFADRSGVPDVSAFVTVLIQSATFGTSIAQALRVYAAEMRDKRLMRAEEKANTLPTKLTLGTMMFTVPPLILILIGPSLIEIARALAGLGNR